MGIKINGQDVTQAKKAIRFGELAIGGFFRYTNGSERKIYQKLTHREALDWHSREVYPAHSRATIVVYTDVSVDVGDACDNAEDLDDPFRSTMPEARLLRPGDTDEADYEVLDDYWDHR